VDRPLVTASNEHDGWTSGRRRRLEFSDAQDRRRLLSTQQFTTPRLSTNVKSVTKIDDDTVAFETQFRRIAVSYTLSYV